MCRAWPHGSRLTPCTTPPLLHEPPQHSPRSGHIRTCRHGQTRTCRSRLTRLAVGKWRRLDLPGGQDLGAQSSSLSPLRIPTLSLLQFNDVPMDGNHLAVACSLRPCEHDCVIDRHVLIDCGASGFTFIDEDFTRHHNLPRIRLHEPRTLEVIDGRPIASGAVTHMNTLTMTIADHKETLPLFVTKLGHYPIVLGIPWLRHHDVTIHFALDQMTFGPQHCPFCSCADRPTTGSKPSTDVLPPDCPTRP